MEGAAARIGTDTHETEEMTLVSEGYYSDHLLRTLASVPPVQTILEIGSGWHTRALAQLGFDFYSIESDADRFERTRDQLVTLLSAESIEKRLMLGSYLNLPYTSEAFDCRGLASDEVGSMDLCGGALYF